MPLAIDTLNIYRRLKSTGFTEESAREITEIFRETVEENLASKNDLKITESNLTKHIESIRSELKKDIEQLRSELKKDIESVRSELKKDIAESKADTIKWVAGMLVAQAALIATLVKLL
ncbi:MAG: CCDC90 family protein [Deltaproteobacteria bacterium]|nr:CCDC90 family protein [Deltaproteobacteria bacterium]